MEIIFGYKVDTNSSDKEMSDNTRWMNKINIRMLVGTFGLNLNMLTFKGFVVSLIFALLIFYSFLPL